MRIDVKIILIAMALVLVSCATSKHEVSSGHMQVETQDTSISDAHSETETSRAATFALQLDSLDLWVYDYSPADTVAESTAAPHGSLRAIHLTSARAAIQSAASGASHTTTEQQVISHTETALVDDTSSETQTDKTAVAAPAALPWVDIIVISICVLSLLYVLYIYKTQKKEK